MSKRALLLGVLLLSALKLHAAPLGASADGVWETHTSAPAGKPAWVRPPKGQAVRLNTPALTHALQHIRKEETPTAPPLDEITLPMPDGSFARFHIIESPVMAPELAAKFPEIKTYRGVGIDDPAATVRLDWTPAGFHAQILSPNGAVYIDPYSRGDNEWHTSYYKRDYRKAADGWTCLTKGGDAPPAFAPAVAPMNATTGPTLRIYRLACAATGEYTAYQGGTVTAGMAAIVTCVNRVTGVYEIDIGIRMVLVANNDLLVYTNASTDPYTNDSASKLLTENQTNCDAVIGSSNYDIGHVVGTGGGGLAYLGVVCQSNYKARGETGSPAPTGDAFYIDYVAHEMGHEFGGNHTFNSVTGSCGGGNRSAAHAYEIGSGTTIMAYAGICGADDTQPHSDPYFLFDSYDEITTYIASGGTCSSNTATGNNPPTVNAGANYTIPASTPFTLTASGTDPDGDPLTFCWEERDLGAAQALTDPDNGTSPLFRSFNPTTDPSRTFPKLSAILTGASSLGEKLPTTTRTMNFRVTARDNRLNGGGSGSADMSVSVVSTAGPFAVTSPNTSVTVSGTVSVAWNVAGTASAPINTTGVNILLSTNSGNNFTIMLASNTPNDGVQSVSLPAISNNTARIKIQGTGNIFFDISDADFSIRPGIPAPAIINAGATLVAENCPPGNAVIDPDETVIVNFALQNAGTANTTNLVATLLATGGVTGPSSPQTYGVLSTNGALVTKSFTFTATGACGGTITAVLQLQDGPVNYGTITNIFTLGVINTQSFTNANTGSIAIPAVGSATPYPSTINISGITGGITKVTVTLTNLSHANPDDLDILLVSSTGNKVMLMSDAGGSTDINNVTLTFDAFASSTLPDSTIISSGTYQPTDYTTGDNMSPAPAGPYGTDLTVFNGADPNGTWSLYIMDDSNPRTGTLGGWKLNVTTATTNCCVNPDTDGDGMPNAWEVAHGLNPNNPADAGIDSDGDGFTNLQEYLAGTDPQNPSDAFRITATGVDTNNNFRLTFPTVAGKTYAVDTNADLTVTNGWHTFTNNLAGTGSLLTITDPTALTQTNRFYRVRLITP